MAEVVPKKKELNIRERQLVEAYVRTGNKSKAAKEVYNPTSDQSASAMADEVLKKPHVKAYMDEVLDKAGLTDDSLARSLRKTLRSSIRARSLKKATPSDALRAIELGYRLKDRFPADRKQVDVRSINVNLDGKDDSELTKTLDEILNSVNEMKRHLQSED